MFEELTYICLDVPEPVASELIAIRRSQRDDYRAALPAEITVAGSSGLGELAAGQDPSKVFRLIDAVAARTPAIPASFGPVIRFPGTDIFVLLLANEADRRIRELHSELAVVGIEYRPARFDFTPHCTLRSRSPVTDSEAGALLSLRVPDSFVLDTLSIYEVSSDPSGRLPVICRPLHRARLALPAGSN